MIEGQLRVDSDAGTFELGPNDSFYLAPGWEYRLKNVGDVPALFVYSMTPSPE